MLTCWRLMSRTCERFMASPRFIAEMSQPDMTKSLGWTMGSIFCIGVKTELPNLSLPTLAVEAIITDPQ
tara:strand:- start:418 stop:624 length:207 start_codon:yes stop_codon:yes gene_type:complete